MSTPQQKSYKVHKWEILRDVGTSLIAIKKTYPWNERKFSGAVARSIRNSKPTITCNHS